MPVLLRLFRLAVAAAVLAVPASLAAQSQDLLGTWVLDVASSEFGMSPPADSGVTVITRADDRLVLSRTTYAAMGAHGAVTFDLPTDGTTHDGTAADGSAVPASAAWSGDAIVLTIKGESNVGPMDIVDYMMVDGDTLRIERTVAIPGVTGLTQSLVLHRRR